MELLTAVSAGVRYPLNTNSIADLDARAFCTGSKLHDLAYALMPTYLAWLRGKWEVFPLKQQVNLEVFQLKSNYDH